jgi:hypothetical protein
MDKKKILDDIFSNDPFGLLNVKATSSAKTEDQRLVQSFDEINEFYKNHNREPQQVNDINERGLYSRLQGIRSNVEKVEALKKYDINNLLDIPEPEQLDSIDDIFSSDPFGILGGSDEGLFDFKNVPNKEEMEKRLATDFVARRKPCKDFDKYEPLFKQVQSELKSGKRKIVDFNISNFQEETFYVHNGVLFYLEKIDFSREDHYREDGTRVRKDGRTRCVFENGTESNMLKRSVEKMLYENGRAVTHSIDTDEIELLKNAQTITKEDNSTGFIYVLSSLSNEPKIKEIQHLYKIGYSTIPVKDRIKNAEKEPTYLMSPVKVEAEYETYNLNTQKFEQLLHNFFGSACLNVDVYDAKGKRHIPQEWFIAPIHVIDRVIDLILKGEIINYVYHLQSESIVKKKH